MCRRHPRKHSSGSPMRCRRSRRREAPNGPGRRMERLPQEETCRSGVRHPTPTPQPEIREAFRVLDRDGNGFISKQELGMAMRSLGYMPSEVELAIIMQRLDMDGDGQVDFDEFMTILGPKLVSSEGRDGFLGNTIDSIFWQFDMQRITLEELKHILYHAFQDHLTMKDIENIIISEEESLNDTAGNCQTEFEGGRRRPDPGPPDPRTPGPPGTSGPPEPGWAAAAPGERRAPPTPTPSPAGAHGAPRARLRSSAAAPSGPALPPAPAAAPGASGQGPGPAGPGGRGSSRQSGNSAREGDPPTHLGPRGPPTRRRPESPTCTGPLPRGWAGGQGGPGEGALGTSEHWFDPGSQGRMWGVRALEEM
uniref:EF-hand domain-containing protein n=1 Tax=Ornithorhynchus anatinus TaxID=9258 RepID=A0A6I8NS22_ORNAN